ncbi:adenylate kinase [Pseudoalteromonas rubra]|uniref:Adenylate kinase n=1 Tax=Pseudoalteromonas rubra TaxID=43658 RepID=A0A5S3WPX2_9GAMM|nr:shikimate kinase [Pseudoalteromonas rubra]TMP30419.1 adenylate kinase [Pseudoalteromonas rubra]TMP35443.1 adenylate kinase [Pseudoalteromonas rubra]
MKRINVIGTSGSGKSTFSRMLASELNYPYLEMDAIFWKPNWQESSDEEFFSNLADWLSGEHWVLDGNYSRTSEIKWGRVDTIIWVDYSFARTLFQAVKRAFIRIVTKKELWGKTGNVESFRKCFLSKKSIILWTLQTYSYNRVRYAELLNDPKYSHIKFVRITSPKKAQTFIDELRT